MKKLMIFFLLVCFSGCTIDRRVFYINGVEEENNSKYNWDKIFQRAANSTATAHHISDIIKTLLGK